MFCIIIGAVVSSALEPKLQHQNVVENIIQPDLQTQRRSTRIRLPKKCDWIWCAKHSQKTAWTWWLYLNNFYAGLHWQQVHILCCYDDCLLLHGFIFMTFMSVICCSHVVRSCQAHKDRWLELDCRWTQCIARYTSVIMLECWVLIF